MNLATLSAVAVMAVQASVPGQELGAPLVYDSPSSMAEVTLVQIGAPEAKELLLQVRGLDPHKDGVILTKQDDHFGGEQHTYLGVGGVGGFWLEDQGESTLVRGTETRYLTLATDGLSPVKVFLNKDKSAQADAQAVAAAYAKSQGVAPANATPAALTAQLKTAAAATASACGAKALQIKVDWDAFQKAGTTAQVGGVARVLEALGDVCSDADYRAAVKKLSAVDVASASAQSFTLQGATLHVALGPLLENVKLQAGKWLKSSL